MINGQILRTTQNSPLVSSNHKEGIRGTNLQRQNPPSKSLSLWRFFFFQEDRPQEKSSSYLLLDWSVQKIISLHSVIKGNVLRNNNTKTYSKWK